MKSKWKTGEQGVLPEMLIRIAEYLKELGVDA